MSIRRIIFLCDINRGIHTDQKDGTAKIKLTTKAMLCSDFIPKPPPIIVNSISNMADIYTVSKLLGHASVKTTEKYYVDLVDDNYKSALDGLDKII